MSVTNGRIDYEPAERKRMPNRERAMKDDREICESCGQYKPLPKPDIGRLSALDELKGTVGPRGAKAKTFADVATPKQCIAIRAIANSHRLYANKECQDALGCGPHELSRRAASAFIDYLKRIGLERRVAERMTA
jgi:hypothetical protein